MDFNHLSQQDQLKDTFSHTFRVKHIASPLIESEMGNAKSIDCDVLLQSAILRLKDEKNIVVLQDGKTCGIITRDDLHKPAVRMWLFGMLTIVEANLTEAIQILYPDDKWMSLISEGRLGKTRSLFEERKRIGKPCALINCLHLIDKFEIMLKNKEYMKILGYESKKQLKKTIKALEDLRNALAHGNRFAFDEKFWAIITLIAANYDDILQAKTVKKIISES